MRRLFKQFSFPGGIGSHCTPETPGSIHEGGELGYSVSHAYGAAFDNPDLIVTVMVGDGEAETGPLATAWHSNKFLNPVRDGAVLPVLHLNGYKIANPTILARISHEELEIAVRRLRLRALFRRGVRPRDDAPGDGRHVGPLCPGDPANPAGGARESLGGEAAALADDHPAQPERLDGSQGGGWTQGRRLLARAPGAARRAAREARASETARGMAAQLSSRRSCSTRPAGCCRSFASSPRKVRAAWARTRTPTAGCCASRYRCPTSATMQSRSEQPGRIEVGPTHVLGQFLRDVARRNPTQLPRLQS